MTMTDYRKLYTEGKKLHDAVIPCDTVKIRLQLFDMKSTLYLCVLLDGIPRYIGGIHSYTRIKETPKIVV